MQKDYEFCAEFWAGGEMVELRTTVPHFSDFRLSQKAGHPIFDELWFRLRLRTRERWIWSCRGGRRPRSAGDQSNRER